MSQKKISGYVIHMDKLLGKGSYGAVNFLLIKVYKGVKEKTDELVAVKIIAKKSSIIFYYSSRLRRLHEISPVLRNTNPANYQVRKCCRLV